MSELKPNHICKNIFCTNGEDGGRKHYYACDVCDKRLNWRAVACSIECYDAYQKQVLDARSKNKAVDVLPDRTDMTKDEIVNEIMEQPEEIVKERTESELADYADVIDEVGFTEAVDQVNKELDAKIKAPRNVNRIRNNRRSKSN